MFRRTPVTNDGSDAQTFPMEFRATKGYSALVPGWPYNIGDNSQGCRSLGRCHWNGRTRDRAWRPAGPVGFAIGGSIFAIGGGIGGAVLADHTTDLIWEVKPVDAP